MKKLLTSLFIFAFLFSTIIGVSALEESMRSVDEIVLDIRTDLGITENEVIDVRLVDEALLEELGDSVMEEYIGDSERHEALDEYYGGDDSETLTDLHIQIGSDYLNGYPITMRTFMHFGYNNDQSNYGPMMRGYQNDGYYDNSSRGYGMMGGYNNDQSNYYGPMMRGNQNDGYYYNSSRGYGMMGRNYNRNNGDSGYGVPVSSAYTGYGMMNFGSGGMIVGMFGFILLIVVLAYLFSQNSRNQSLPTSNNALNIAKERYARGEITREEFLVITNSLK